VYFCSQGAEAQRSREIGAGYGPTIGSRQQSLIADH
jgi:hypothetical protein